MVEYHCDFNTLTAEIEELKLQIAAILAKLETATTITSEEADEIEAIHGTYEGREISEA